LNRRSLVTGQSYGWVSVGTHVCSNNLNSEHTLSWDLVHYQGNRLALSSRSLVTDESYGWVSVGTHVCSNNLNSNCASCVGSQYSTA